MTPSTASRLLVIGDIVDGLDAPSWVAALQGAGWSGPITVHEHPGRTGDHRLPGGNHEDLDAAFALGGTDLIGPDVVVLGIRRSGPVATLLGLGGRAAAVAAVDGLGGPFVPPVEQIGSTLAAMRATILDADSHDLPGPGEVDRRLGHGLASHGDRDTAAGMIEVLPVPILAVETPSSPVSVDDAAALTDAHPHASLLRAGDGDPVRVAGGVAAWTRSLG